MASKTERIEARIAPDRAERIRKAAALEGVSTSAFVVDAAADRAERILRRWHETVVPAEFFDELLAALDEPPVAIAALKRAAERFERIPRDDGSAIIRKRTSRRKPSAR